VKELLLGSSPGQEVFGGYDEDVARFLSSVPASARHVILKCHTLDPVGRALARTGAAKVVFTWRNVADAIVSFTTMFGYDFEHALSVMETSLELFRFHRQGGQAAVIHYEEVTNDPEQAVERIAACLFGDTGYEAKVNPVSIEEIAKQYAIENMRAKAEELGRNADDSRLIHLDRTVYDPETLLNLRHIRDGRSGYGRGALTPEQAGRVDALVRRYDLAQR
jgi:hypothetical protein